MAEWTRDAKDYLEGYLLQTAALARGRGEDGDEIADDLRCHVHEEVERADTSLVTLELVQKVVAGLGLTGDEGTASGPGVVAGPGNLRPTEPVSASPFVRKAKTCTVTMAWLVAAMLLGLVILSVVSQMLAVYLPTARQRTVTQGEMRIEGPPRAVDSSKYAMPPGTVMFGNVQYMELKEPDEQDAAAVGMLRELRLAEELYKTGKPEGSDKARGVYGGLDELAKAGLMERRDVPGYAVKMELTPEKLAYTCTLVPDTRADAKLKPPEDERGNVRQFIMTQEGKVCFTLRPKRTTEEEGKWGPVVP